MASKEGDARRKNEESLIVVFIPSPLLYATPILVNYRYLKRSLPFYRLILVIYQPVQTLYAQYPVVRKMLLRRMLLFIWSRPGSQFRDHSKNGKQHEMAHLDIHSNAIVPSPF
jgi:hypothetical protein